MSVLGVSPRRMVLHHLSAVSFSRCQCLFVIRPTIQVTTAPATPAAKELADNRAGIHCAGRARNSGQHYLQNLTSNATANRAQRLLRKGPRLKSFDAAPAAFPPITPATIWTNKLVSIPDMVNLRSFKIQIPPDARMMEHAEPVSRSDWANAAC